MFRVKFKFRDFHRDLPTAYPWKLYNLFCNITSRCDQACQYCHSPKDSFGNKDMPLSLLQRAANQAKEIDVKNFVLTGGEPLLHPQLEKILEILSGYDFNIKMATNGVSIDKNIIDLLKHFHVKSLQVSIDTLNKEHYLLVRGVNRLERVIENIREIISGDTIHLAVSSVGNRIIIDDLEELLMFCFNEGIHTFTLTKPIPVHTGARNNHLLLSDEEFVRLLDRLINTFYQRTNHALLELGYPYARDSYLHKKWRDSIAINITTCEGGRNSLTISVDGRVTPCVCFEDEDFYFGDIKSENLGDLWNSEFLGYFRGKNKYRRCDPCNRWEDCLGGCRAMALLATGRLDSSDPFCAFWNRSPNNK